MAIPTRISWPSSHVKPPREPLECNVLHSASVNRGSRLGGADQCISFEQTPIFDDEVHVLGIPNIGKRIGVEYNEVGELASLDRQEHFRERSVR